MADTFLRLYDSKGGFIKQNDDVEGEKGNLNSSTQFVPEVSGTYYISAGAYTGNPEHENMGAYTVMVTAVELDPTLGAPIEGTDMADMVHVDANNDGVIDDGAIQTLSVANDYNNDGDFVDTLDETADNMDYNGDGDMLDTSVTEAGVFIL